MNRTAIEWTDFSARPIKYRDADGRAAWGCIKASAGCQNCYAEAISRRYRGPGAGFTAKRMEGLTPYVDKAELKAMLSPRRLPAGSKVFVGDMTDIFGPWVPFDMLDRLFAVFALRPDVVFQVLTKRPERMREYLSERASPTGAVPIRIASAPFEAFVEDKTAPWRLPLPNVWVGVSAEDQDQADKRIPELLATPAAVRFVSAEPLLGPVDLTTIRHGNDNDLPVLGTQWGPDWVIVGGESGPGARPCDIGWIRSIVEQCKAAGVACFVKQLGAKPMAVGVRFGRVACGACGTEDCAVGTLGYPPHVAMWRTLRDRKGSDMAEWSDDLRVREMPR